MENRDEPSSSGDIRLDQIGSVALVTLERVKSLNALTIAMRASLLSWFPQFSRDPKVYAVAIRSASPKAFSAGSDVREVVALGCSDMEAARQNCIEGRDLYVTARAGVGVHPADGTDADTILKKADFA